MHGSKIRLTTTLHFPMLVSSEEQDYARTLDNCQRAAGHILASSESSEMSLLYEYPSVELQLSSFEHRAAFRGLPHLETLRRRGLKCHCGPQRLAPPASPAFPTNWISRALHARTVGPCMGRPPATRRTAGQQAAII